MLSAAVDRVDIVGVVLVIVRLVLHLWAVGSIVRRSWVAMGLRLGWIGVVQVDVLELRAAEAVSEAWVPPKRHMSRLVIVFPLVLSCERDDRRREGSKGCDKRFVHLLYYYTDLFSVAFKCKDFEL